MSCCGRCCKPIIEGEFEISNDIITNNNPPQDIKIPIIPTTDIDLLKEKVICDFQRIISDLERGLNPPDLEFLLETISAIELDNEINNREFIIQYYLNNG